MLQRNMIAGHTPPMTKITLYEDVLKFYPFFNFLIVAVLENFENGEQKFREKTITKAEEKELLD